MVLLYRIHIYGCVALLMLLIPLVSNAQNSVWGSTDATKKETNKKATNTGRKLKNFKDHLRHWGLDTNYNHAFLIGGKLNSD